MESERTISLLRGLIPDSTELIHWTFCINYVMHNGTYKLLAESEEINTLIVSHKTDAPHQILAENYWFLIQ